jgi:protein-disulfide isomerase
VKLVYKHLPLDSLHPQARRVSEASWCAAKQDKFWAFHDAVYADSTSDASDATLARYATKAGLDVAAFTACLANPETRAAIQRDVAQGEALGLSSTPGFFINGREVRGAQPLEAFVSVIDEELRGARR